MKENRRQFLKTSALSGLVIAAHPKLFGEVKTHPEKKAKDIPLPTYPQMEWQDAEFGVIFHFDISIGTKNFRGDNQVRETFNLQDYNPQKLNTDQWVKAAKDAGVKYATFTATHFGGFLQWQSDLYPYGLKQAKWKNGKGDIVADFVKSCYKYGLKPGLYLSTHRNAYWHADNYYVDWGKGKGTIKQKEYNRICEKMVEELCSRYGRLLQIWFDAGTMTPAQGGPNVLPVFERYQPNGNFYASYQRADFRWVGNERGMADYPCWATMPDGPPYSHLSPEWKKYLESGDPHGSAWSPAMADTPLRGANGIHSWFWEPGQENGAYSIEQLWNIYLHSVGRNSNMVLGVVIDPDGLVPDSDAKRLNEFGDFLNNQFIQPLGNTQGEGNNFILELKKPVRLQRYVLQEDIRFGERVRDYEIKGQTEQGDWISLDKGSCIGHKRIGEISQDKLFKQVKLKIVQSKEDPHIRNFQVF